MKERSITRPVQSGEPERERKFWERYWQALGEQGIRPDRCIWHERAVRQFIRFVSPKRLKEVGTRDVTDWLRLMAHQPRSEAWRVNQARRALKVLFQKVLRLEWAKEWPAGFIGEAEEDTWIGAPAVGPMKIKKGESEVRRRFGGQLEKMVRAIRYLHYSYRTEETYVGWAVKFLGWAGGEEAGQFTEDHVRGLPGSPARHPHRAGIARTRARGDDADLHARDAEARSRGEESAGPVKAVRRGSERRTLNVER
jgi:Phage integrase, N-terminal SAM-like domain